MKQLLKNIFALFGFFTLFYFLQRASLAETIAPFAVSFIFALFCIESPNFWFLLSYFASGLLSHLTPLGIVIIVLQVTLIFALIIFERFIKTKLKPLVFGVVLVISQMPEIFIFRYNGLVLANFLISIILSVLFYYLFLRLIYAVKNRGLKSSFTVDELFGVFILVVGITLGTGAVELKGFNFALVVTLMALLLLSNLTSVYPMMFYAVASGVSFMLAYNQSNYFVIFVVWALVLALFKDSYKLITVIMIILSDVLLGVVFNVYLNYGFANFLMVAIMGVAYFCLPKKINNQIKNKLEYVRPDPGQLDEMFRQSVKNKLSSFVGLLYDIDSIYKDMVRPMSDFTSAKSEIAKDVCKRVCKDCINRKSCYDKNVSGIEFAVESSLEIAIKKGEIKVIDMPASLARCPNYSLLVGNINQASKKYLALIREASAENMGKITIGNQLKGVADSLRDFNSSLTEDYRADREYEQKYIKELLYNDIIAEDCQIIFCSDGKLKSISILLKMSNNKSKFLCVTQNFFKCFLKISESKYSDNSGWQIVSLTKKPRYGFVFGSATVGHNGKIVNGDSHSCIQLSGDRYLLSIADGKGHGKVAEKTSNLTISLIEKFFKANISTQTVVTSVNQILSFNSTENFSAVDLCIVDQNNGRADFVKLGSTPTLIKRGEKVRIISGSGLPMGVSKMATAFYESEFLSVGDIVIMTSDGVFDGFDSPENFAGFVNNLRLLNMDMLAKCLLEESIKLNGGKIKDDLTVVAFRWLVDY